MQAYAERLKGKLKGKLKGRPHITLPDSLMQNKEENLLQASSWWQSQTKTVMITTKTATIIVMIILMLMMEFEKCFPAQDDLGMCRESVVTAGDR